MRKLSDSLTNDLSFLTQKELEDILNKLGDEYQDERIELIKYISKKYTDEDITPLLKQTFSIQRKGKDAIEKEISEIRSYYISDTNNKVDKIVRGRGRKKLKDGTLKDKIFKLMDKGIDTYEGLLKEDGIFLAENTYKTILSQWRKVKGIKSKRGRKAK